MINVSINNAEILAIKGKYEYNHFVHPEGIKHGVLNQGAIRILTYLSRITTILLTESKKT